VDYTTENEQQDWKETPSAAAITLVVQTEGMGGFHRPFCKNGRKVRRILKIRRDPYRLPRISPFIIQHYKASCLLKAKRLPSFIQRIFTGLCNIQFETLE
jgi:hypothetical protein